MKSKVLMVSMLFPPAFGGASVQSIRLAKALIQQGQQVEFITDNGTSPTIKTDYYEQIAVTRLKTYSDNILSKFRELVFSIKLVVFIATRPDIKIVHFHAIRGLELLTFPILRLLGKKIILKLTLVGVDDPMAFKGRRLLSPFFMLGLKAAHAMVAISQELKDRALMAGFSDDVVKKIYNGFDEENFHIPTLTAKQSLREQFGLPNDSAVFLSVGKVEYRKGYDLLLQAFLHIQQKVPNSYLLIVGPDNIDTNSYYLELNQFVEENNIRNVKFLGRQQKVYEYVQASDYFLFCSRQEGFGTVLIEAMACGLPTIAMNIKGVTEDIVTDSRIGIINYSHSPNEFAEQALALISSVSPEKTQEAVTAIGDQFSITKIAESYIALYQSL